MNLKFFLKIWKMYYLFYQIIDHAGPYVDTPFNLKVSLRNDLWNLFYPKVNIPTPGERAYNRSKKNIETFFYRAVLSVRHFFRHPVY